MLLRSKKSLPVQNQENEEHFKKALITHHKTRVKEKRIIDNEPTNKQLTGNLLLRSLVGSLSSYITISNKNYIGSALALANLSMWLTKDLSQIRQRKNQINTNEYNENNYKELSWKEIKSTDDISQYLHDKQHKIARHLFTLDAVKEVMQYIAFDLIPEELIYQQYQSSHPPSVYKNSQDFLKREHGTLITSIGIGILAYPLLNLFNNLIPETGRLLSKPFLKQ
jgi:hypothetical protein